jgi:hypothetical protein
MTLTASPGIMPQKRQQRQCSLNRGTACAGAASAVAAVPGSTLPLAGSSSSSSGEAFLYQQIGQGFVLIARSARQVQLVP